MSRKIVTGVRALLLTLMAGFAAACSVSETKAPRRLVITGPSQQVEQYLAQQAALRPTLRASLSAPDSRGQIAATLVLPKTYSGDDVVDLAGRASDARLSWSYSEGGSTRTLRLG